LVDKYGVIGPGGFGSNGENNARGECLLCPKFQNDRAVRIVSDEGALKVTGELIVQGNGGSIHKPYLCKVLKTADSWKLLELTIGGVAVEVQE
jgi:hypothetical protein